MYPKKETLITAEQQFPVDVFMQDNLRKHVVVEPHWHDCVELLFMVAGKAEQRINEQCFMLNEGDLLVINQGDVHSTVCYPGEDIRILVIKFLPEILEATGIKAFESKYITAFLGSDIKLSGTASTYSKKLVLDIYKEFIERKVAYEISIKGCIYLLIAELVRSELIKVYKPDINGQQLKDLHILINYIEQNFAQPINLADSANMLNFSYHYLSRFFKKATGKNFKEYVDFVRVCEAEKLILSTNMTIAAIAFEVGFGNVSSFNRVYQRVRGYNPLKLKKSRATSTTSTIP